MASVNSTKPRKPHKDFPLFAHNNGQWAKKIKGKFHYFGPWDDPDSAFKLWLEQKDDRLAGRKPRDNRNAFTLSDLCNLFLTDRQHRVDAGELTKRTFNEYHQSCKRLIEAFGRNRDVLDLRQDDFLSLRQGYTDKWGPVTLANEIQRVRTLFKFAYDAGLIESPIKFGPTFVKPSQRTLRLHRKQKGQQLFSPQEIKRMVCVASPQIRAMILLGINLGFGNRDCAYLPIEALDLKNGWYDYFRTKTAVDRRAKLWPETVEALNAVISVFNP